MPLKDIWYISDRSTYFGMSTAENECRYVITNDKSSRQWECDTKSAAEYLVDLLNSTREVKP